MATKSKDGLAITYMPLSQVEEWGRNPKAHDIPGIQGSVRRFGFNDCLSLNDHPEAHFLLEGHGRVESLRAMHDAGEPPPKNILMGPEEWLVPVVILRLPPGEAEAYALAHNQLTTAGGWDDDALSSVVADLDSFGVDLSGLGWNDAEIAAMVGEKEPGPQEPGGGDEPPENPADELQRKWGTESGQLWQCGEHRIICGDCTDQEVVARVMGGEKAVLVHADPPYGMGKEADGIANDNLYREKLDAFQMEWWKACRPHLEDNGSAYVWGNPEDLWRLWHAGGLKDSERLTFRNEIVWDKGSGFGQRSESQRSYSVNTERCLFFMVGQQHFGNVNKEDFFEGFEEIRSWLHGQCELMGWGQKDIERICGVGMYGHWFTKSQWCLIPEKHYNTLQSAAEGKAFLRTYCDVKDGHIQAREGGDHLDPVRSFNAMRAYFDNTHDNMNEVWNFGRVHGEERMGHATPKPVTMVERAVRSSSREDDAVIAPFLGTGPEIVACERLGRRCRGIELSPAYVAVCLERWHLETGKEPQLLA